jgi:hypothetical protein
MAQADPGPRSDSAGAVAFKLDCRQGAIPFRSDLRPLNAAGTIADGNVFFPPVQHQAHRSSNFAREVDREQSKIADAVLGPEIASDLGTRHFRSEPEYLGQGRSWIYEHQFGSAIHRLGHVSIRSGMLLIAAWRVPTRRVCAMPKMIPLKRRPRFSSQRSDARPYLGQARGLHDGPN